MEKNDVVSICESVAPHSVLNVTPFGNSSKKCFWIEAKALARVSRALYESEKVRARWLENISVIEVDQSLVLNYFLSFGAENDFFVLRVTLLPSSPEAEVLVDSVSEVWAAAEMFERENQKLFGIQFLGLRNSSFNPLPEAWIGFPLRKSYVYPQEYLGIPHFRNKTSVSS